MTWAIFNDHTPWHPKLLKAGPEAAWFWFACICYSNAHHLDGRLERSALAVVAPWAPKPKDREKLIARCVDARLLIDEKTHVVVHDYKRHQQRALKERVEQYEDERDSIKRYERERKRAQRAQKSAQDEELPVVPAALTGSAAPANSASPTPPEMSRTVPDTSGTGPGGTGLGWVGSSEVLDPVEEKSPEVRDLHAPASLAEAERVPQKPIGQHKARDPRMRVWQLYEQLTGTIQGDVSANLRSLEVLVRVCAARAGAKAGAAFDAAVTDLLKAWLQNPWVAEHRPGLGHLAKAPAKYLAAPGGSQAASRRALAPVSSRDKFQAAAARNPVWLDQPPKERG